jgi:hypothetical protein
MSKLTLKRNLIGTINIPDGIVDITDPCYNKDVWCRHTTEVMPGTYNCYTYIGEDKDWGNRCWITQIVIADGDESDIAEDRICSGRSWRSIADIGVDAGLAGFFNHKPDFNDDEWHEFCNMMRKHRANENAIDALIHHFKTGDGFWTESGCGDGMYPVYAIREKGKIIALEIRF